MVTKTRKTRKTVGKSKQSGSSRKPKNLDLTATHAGAVKGGGDRLKQNVKA